MMSSKSSKTQSFKATQANNPKAKWEESCERLVALCEHLISCSCRTILPLCQREVTVVTMPILETKKRQLSLVMA